MTSLNEVHWRKPRITLAACLELGGRWLVIVLCGILLLTALLLSLQSTQAQLLREARLEIALQGLRERLETNLSLGFELADSEHAQAMLEELLTADPSLLSAEVFDSSAVSLFNTDRGAIGERVPAAWLSASSLNSSTSYRSRRSEASATSSDHWTWSVDSDEDAFTLGLPIRGPFGEIAGQVSITSASPPSIAPWPLISLAFFCAFCLATAGLILTIWLLRRLAAERDDASMDLAASRLQAAESRLTLALEYLKRNEDNA